MGYSILVFNFSWATQFLHYCVYYRLWQPKIEYRHIPVKDDNAAENEPRIKVGNILNFHAGTHMQKWPFIKEKHIEVELRIYIIFVFELDDK